MSFAGTGRSKFSPFQIPTHSLHKVQRKSKYSAIIFVSKECRLIELKIKQVKLAGVDELIFVVEKGVQSISANLSFNENIIHLEEPAHPNRARLTGAMMSVGGVTDDGRRQGFLI